MHPRVTGNPEQEVAFGEIPNKPCQDFPLALGNLSLFKETFHTFISGWLYTFLTLVRLKAT